MSRYAIQVETEEFNLIWVALGKLPAEATRLLMNKLQHQVETQEQSNVDPPSIRGENN